MKPTLVRALRIAALFTGASALLWFRFASGTFRETEVDRVIAWAFLPIALLFGLGAGAMEVSGSGAVSRRDSFWALSGALLGFSILRLAGLT
jgi:hypothetical protein